MRDNDDLQVCKVLGADGLVYQEVSDLLDAGHEQNPAITTFDAACFDGKYVAEDVTLEYLDALASSGRGAGRTRSGQLASLVGF